MGLIAAGVSLWLINWWAARPLFLDEANVARNLYDRSFAGLFLPLDHRQYAPPLYLVLAKVCGELFGYGERSLRLPALLGGLMSVVGLLWARRELKLGWWGLLPLVLLFVNPYVLRYVTEVKPYGLDLGLAATFLAWAASNPKPDWKIGLAGAVGLWVSLPLVFVLAAVGLHKVVNLMWRPARHTAPPTGLSDPSSTLISWLLCGGGWLVSFGILYWLVLDPAVGSAYLRNYHSDYYFPLPGMMQFGTVSDLVFTILRIPFGHTVLAGVIGLLTMILAVYYRRGRWLLLPAALVLVASSFRFYSLMPRLLLFTLPGWWLAAAIISRQTDSSAVFRWTLLLLWVIVSGGTNVAKHFAWPVQTSDSRRLVREIEPGYTPVLHHGAVPAYDYYHRIHPGGSGLPYPAEERRFGDLTDPERVVLLYDVLTQGNIRGSMTRDSTQAAVLGGCGVRKVEFYRAAAVYVDCP